MAVGLLRDDLGGERRRVAGRGCENQPGTGTHPFAGPEQDTPQKWREFVEQENLNEPPGRFFVSPKSSRDYSRIIDDEHIPRAQVLGKFGKGAVLNGSSCPIEQQET